MVTSSSSKSSLPSLRTAHTGGSTIRGATAKGTVTKGAAVEGAALLPKTLLLKALCGGVVRLSPSSPG